MRSVRYIGTGVALALLAWPESAYAHGGEIVVLPLTNLFLLALGVCVIPFLHRPWRAKLLMLAILILVVASTWLILFLPVHWVWYLMGHVFWFSALLLLWPTLLYYLISRVLPRRVLRLTSRSSAPVKSEGR